MKISKLSPNFEVHSIRETVGFYQEHLGFNLVMAVNEAQDGIVQDFENGKEYVYALVQKDGVEFMFQRTDTFKEDVLFSKGLSIGASVSFYFEIENIQEFYSTLKAKNLKITDLKTTWYGMQEFYLQDNNGYILAFAEKI